VQTHFRAFHDWLDEHGHPWQLVTPYAAPRWLVYPVFALRKMINPLHKTASVAWYRYWHVHFLRMALRQVLADGEHRVVYAQCPLSADAALAARASPLQRVLMVVHFNVSQADEWAGKGMLSAEEPLFRAIRAFEANVLPRLDGLVYSSDFMRRELTARIPALSDVPYALIPNFVKDPGVTLGAPLQADLINIGTLEPRKNQGYLLDIVAAAQRQGRKLALTLVGDGPDHAALERRAAELGIASSVRFAGYVGNAAALMTGHRAYIHAARMDNLPFSVIEALSRGLPVFAVPVGGVPEVFDDGLHGRNLPADDAAAAAAIIVAFLDDSEKMSAARELARQRFLEKFESSHAAARLYKFLQTRPARR
jgi:glycosyltransferase involved in cell wall biosynthesis